MRSLVNHAVDWPSVEWVLLDMDGTLLDLSFDNYFWRELVPLRYAEKNGLTLQHAREVLKPKFLAVQHTLPWYCTDYWSEVTGLDMAALKHEIRHRIGALPGAEDFLEVLRASGRQVWLATNAHRDSWRLKMEFTGLGRYFHHIVSSHDFGYAKEDPLFWQALRKAYPFEPRRSLFVDDSAPVLAAARDFGIGQVLGVRHPDRSQAPRDLPGFRTVETVAELLSPATSAISV